MANQEHRRLRSLVRSASGLAALCHLQSALIAERPMALSVYGALLEIFAVYALACDADGGINSLTLLLSSACVSLASLGAIAAYLVAAAIESEVARGAGLVGSIATAVAIGLVCIDSWWQDRMLVARMRRLEDEDRRFTHVPGWKRNYGALVSDQDGDERRKAAIVAFEDAHGPIANIPGWSADYGFFISEAAGERRRAAAVAAWQQEKPRC